MELNSNTFYSADDLCETRDELSRAYSELENAIEAIDNAVCEAESIIDEVRDLCEIDSIIQVDTSELEDSKMHISTTLDDLEETLEDMPNVAYAHQDLLRCPTCKNVEGGTLAFVPKASRITEGAEYKTFLVCNHCETGLAEFDGLKALDHGVVAQ